MGKSRSATVLTAYLMASRRLAPHLALGIIKRVRPFVEPNSGFMQQLELYYQMEFAENIEDHPIYQRWVYLRDVEMSNAAGRAPERIHFRDAEAEIGRITGVKEDETPKEKSGMQLKCKKCRYVYHSSLSLPFRFFRRGIPILTYKRFPIGSFWQTLPPSHLICQNLRSHLIARRPNRLVHIISLSLSFG